MPVYYSKTRKQYYLRESVGGVRKYCYSNPKTGLPFRTKTEAREALPSFILSLTSKPKKAEKSTLCDELFPLYLRDVKDRVKPNTYYNLKRVLEHYVFPFFRRMPVMEITNAYLDTVNAKINSRKKNVYQQPSACRGLVRYLRKTNPVLDVDCIHSKKNYKPKDEDCQIYDKPQFERLLATVENESDRFMFTLLFYYGLRCGELLGLKWSDFDGGTLSIRRSVSRRGADGKPEFTTLKTKNSVRDYPIIKAVKPFLETLPRDSVYCFPTRCGTPRRTRERKGIFPTLGPSEVRRIVLKHAKLAGLPHIKIHGFRHSCVSYLLSQGMNYRTVARWVGDTEEVILQTYSHLVPDEKDQIANFLDETYDD